MSDVLQILVSAAARRVLLAGLVAAVLAGCGQKGPLYLPSDADAPGRATLPQTLNPAGSVPARRANGANTAEPIPGQ